MEGMTGYRIEYADWHSRNNKKQSGSENESSVL